MPRSAVASQTLTAACTNGVGDVSNTGTGTSGGLVWAVVQADADSGDTIELGRGCTYTLTQPYADGLSPTLGNWYGPAGLPAIKTQVTIEGNGSTIARSTSAPAFRLFFVGADPSNPSTNDYVSPGPGALTLRQLTLSGGLAQGGGSDGGGGGAGMGGAIFNQGTVALDRSTLSANIARGGPATDAAAGIGGGGIGTDSPPFIPPSGSGGGFGSGNFTGGGTGGGSNSGGGGGGAGLRVLENGVGAHPSAPFPGAGGGPQTGLGGSGGNGAAGGDGSGGGGNGVGDDGGGYGAGGVRGGGGGGGGGGAGGGGAGSAENVPGDSGGGGGFGGGGGSGGSGPNSGFGGNGGFGGGGGSGASGAGAPGFGGGSPTSTAGGGGAGMGGAIFNMQGRLAISASTVAGNAAVGGADNVVDHGKGIGGAVFNLSGDFTASGSTFADNTAAWSQGAASIYNLVYDGSTPRVAQTTLKATIVSGGVGAVDLASVKTADITPPNLGSANADVSQHDLIRTIAAREAGTITGSPLARDPLLGPLQNNSGPTDTMALVQSSPAINRVPRSLCTPTDQRGAARPDDREPTCDIGAYELQDPPNTVITKAKVNSRKHQARFAFRAVGTATRFECALAKSPKHHHKKGKPHFSRCRSPRVYKHLKPGRYTFLVRAVGPVGADPTPAQKRFRIR